MTPIPIPADERREAIARIIDPKAWKALDEIAAYQSQPQADAPWSKYWADRASFANTHALTALAKADAILASDGYVVGRMG